MGTRYEISIEYLGMSVGHCGCDDACREHCDREDLHGRISLSPGKPYEHRCHAAAAAKNDMDGNGNVIAESKVIEKIDGEKEADIREPSNQRYGARFEEEWRLGYGEVSGPCEQGCHDELDKGDEKAWEESSEVFI